MGAAAARPDVAVGVLAGRLQAERVPRCVGVARFGRPRVLERSVRAAQTEEAASTKHQPVNEPEDNPFIPDAEEMIDAAPLETIVDEDEEGDSDIEID